MITNGFPEISEKFILNQVTGLIDAGVELRVYSAMAPAEGTTHHLATMYEVAGRTTYLNIPRSTRARARAVPGLLASGLVHSPGALFRALRTDLYKTAAKNLKTLYFLKAFFGRTYPIVHCQFGPNGLLGAYLKDIGVAHRIVVSFHGSDINSYPGSTARNVYSILYDRSDVITAGTEFARGKLIANGCPEEKIRLLPVGFRTDELAPPEENERSPCTILSVGRLYELKGYRFAIEAFARVRQSFPSAEYMIVGEGSLREELRELARELGVEKSVHFLGAKADKAVADLYRKATVLVMPSVRMPDGTEENQGTVLQEAQACGLPVIATRIGGLPEGLIAGETGFLVPEKDSQALAVQTCRLLGDQPLRRRMGAAGRSFVLPRYDVEVLTRQLLDIYDEVLSSTD